MKRLIDWARQQRRQGNLKQVFRVYTWWKQTERNISIWWMRNVTWVIYQWGIALLPNWGNGHFTLGKALQQRYSYLSRRNSYDANKLTTIGNRSAAHFRKALDLIPQNLETYRHLLDFLLVLERTDEMSIVLHQYDEVKRNLAEICQEDRLGIRFIPTRIPTIIGVIGNLNYYVKAGLLGWRPPHKIILLLPDGIPVSNRCLLDYWCRYITVITDPGTIKVLTPLVNHLEDPIHLALTCNDRTLFTLAANTLVQKQWDAENRPPLLTLTDPDYERGWRCLEGLGVPKDAWFVGLHVREPGFRDGASTNSSYRNADIDSYLPAIKTIVDQGGWVIRMGDPTMKPLPVMEHVIDYALSDIRSDWMDVFLGAQCRFFLGTSSGPTVISIAFGVPMVLTNYLPWNALHHSNIDLFLPKLFWSLKENRHLTFAEILSSPLSAGVSQSFYDNMGVEILDNTPEEINDIVIEMLMRLDGKLTYSASDERLQERFLLLTVACTSLLGAKDLMFNSHIGKDFLRKYETLLDLDTEAVSRLGQLVK